MPLTSLKDSFSCMSEIILILRTQLRNRKCMPTKSIAVAKVHFHLSANSLYPNKMKTRGYKSEIPKISIVNCKSSVIYYSINNPTRQIFSILRRYSRNNNSNSLRLLHG